jgi:hypothetical protein
MLPATLLLLYHPSDGCGDFRVGISPEGSKEMSTFSGTLTAFCEELKACVPEVAAAATLAAQKMTAEKFWSAWRGNLSILLDRSADALFAERRGLLVGAVQLTPALWAELSEGTQRAIWKYLRTLALEAAMTVSLEGVDTETQQILMGIMTAEKLEAGGAEADAAAAEIMEDALPHLQPLMDKLKGLMGNFMDLSGMADIPMPEIPERLRNGRIAKLAEEMARQLNPAEFGIDPALLEGDSVEEVLKRLAEIYQRDPTLLVAGAKRVADKIRKQILGGSLDREALVAEAQEFIAIFKEHPLFKEAISKFQSFAGEDGLASMFGGGGGGGTESERRRAVQERLRKKLEARKAAGAKK